MSSTILIYRKYPTVKSYLAQFKEKLSKRATKQEWYKLQQPQFKYKKFLEAPKIIFPDIAISPRFALDEQGYYCSNTCYFIPGNDLYLLGLLNSAIGNYYFRSVCAGLEGQNETYLRFFGQYLEGFPVHIINQADPSEILTPQPYSHASKPVCLLSTGSIPMPTPQPRIPCSSA